MEHIPLKKRRFWPQPPSPPPRPPAPSPDDEDSLPSPPQNPSPQFGKSEQLVDSKCSSSQQSHSNHAAKSAHGTDEARIDAMTSEVTDVDFSGITLLAVTACSSSIHGYDHNVKDASVLKEYAAARVEASTSATQIEETMTSLERDKSLQKDSINVDKTDGLLVQDNSSALSHNLHNDKNGGAVGMSLPPKSNKLHWDLNTLMDEWEEPYVEIFNSQTTDSRSILNDGMKSGKVTSEVCKVQRDFEETRCDIGSKVHPLSCSPVSSDPHGSQLIIDPKRILLETNKADLEKHTFQVSSGPISIEKTCVATSTENMMESLKFSVAETKAPTPVFSTNASLHDCGCPISDHIACTCFGEKLNTSASTLVQHEKDVSRTSATIHGRLSLQNVQAGKIDVVSTDMPILDKPVCYTDSIKNNDGEDIGKTSGKGPNFSGKLSSEDPSSDCNGSDVSQDNQGHIVSVENIKELQEGYDSPFEEGELREPVVYSRDDIEVEGLESVRQDNGSVDRDNIDAHDKKGEKSGMGGKTALDAGSDKPVEHCGQDSLMKPSCSWSSRTKAYGGNLFREHRGDVNAEGNWDGYDDKIAGEFGARQSTQKFSSHTERPYYDPVHRKNPVFLRRRRSENLPYSYSRAERDFDKSPRRDRFSIPGHEINKEDGHLVNSSAGYRNSGNRYSHTCRGPEGHDYSRPRGLVPNSAAMGSALNYNDDRWSENYSSNYMYRPFIRRRSPPMRGGSHAWSQGRSEIYAHCVRRGSREEYHEGVPDNASASSTRIPHYLDRRDHGFSPNIGRGAHFSRPHRNSRSRSRSRSPLAWDVHRDRRSPVRMFRWSQNQWCDSMGYSGRLKSEDNVRSNISRENFSQMAGAGRGHYFENNDDGRRKRNDRFEMIGRLRHYDASGNMRRYRHDAEDFLEALNSCGEDDCSRRTFGRDAPRSPREERGPSKYDNGRIDASALSSGEQELEEDAPRDVARSAGEERVSSDYNSYRIDNVSFLSGQQDLENDAASRDVLMGDREERGSSKDGSDRADTSASSCGQQELDEDAVPRGE